MDEQRFDRITRRLAERSVTRQSFFGLVGGVVAGGLAVVGLGERARWSRALAAADSEEQSVMLFEQMAGIIHDHAGGCAAMRDKIRAFEAENRELLARIATEQAAWSDAQRTQHADTYGDRRLAAVDRIEQGLRHCESVDAAASPVATPNASPAASAAALPGAVVPVAFPTASPEASPEAALTGVHAFAQSEPACQTDAHLACYQPSSTTLSEYWSGTATCVDYPVQPCTPCGLTAADCFDRFPALCTDPAGATPCIPAAFPTSDACFNPIEVACYDLKKPGAPMIPGSEMTVTAKCDASENCVVCDLPSDHCQQQYPDECGGGGDCEVGYNPEQVCTDVVTAVCMTNQRFPQLSKVITVLANCNAGSDACTFCDTDDLCASRFPDLCSQNGQNICTWVQYTVGPSTSQCCSQNCPQSTSACIGFATGLGIGEGSYTLCLECLLNSCGSTSHCLDTCASDKCCASTCGSVSSDVTRGGTPVAAGTPGTPVVMPTAAGTPAATSTSVPPTVALPTDVPPTVAVPTNPPPTVALPTQPPPTAAAPTQPPPTFALPTEPPATPGTPSS